MNRDVISRVSGAAQGLVEVVDLMPMEVSIGIREPRTILEGGFNVGTDAPLLAFLLELLMAWMRPMLVVLALPVSRVV